MCAVFTPHGSSLSAMFESQNTKVLRLQPEITDGSFCQKWKHWCRR